MKVIIGVLYISSRGIFNCFTRVILDYHKHFSEKCVILQRSRSFLNSKIAENTTWELSTFQARHETLIEMGLKVFKL